MYDFYSYSPYTGRHEEYNEAKTTAKAATQNENHLRRENNLSVRAAHVLCRKQSVTKTTVIFAAVFSFSLLQNCL